jgi:hypothetical protein
MHSYHFEYWIDSEDMDYRGYVVEYPDTVVKGMSKNEVRQKLFDVVWKAKKMTAKKVWTGWLVREGWNRDGLWIRDGWGGINPNGENY